MLVVIVAQPGDWAIDGVTSCIEDVTHLHQERFEAHIIELSHLGAVALAAVQYSQNAVDRDAPASKVCRVVDDRSDRYDRLVMPLGRPQASRRQLDRLAPPLLPSTDQLVTALHRTDPCDCRRSGDSRSRQVWRDRSTGLIPAFRSSG